MKRKNGKKGIFAEFKEFITRGNIIDLSVGVIIGAAFSAIVTALTSNIFQPLISWALSMTGSDEALSGARTVLKAGYTDGALDWTKTIYIDWGAFITAIINFLLVALILFAIVKTCNVVAAKKAKLDADLLEAHYKKHPEERPLPPEEVPPTPTELDVLNEIRDLLKDKKSK